MKVFTINDAIELEPYIIQNLLMRYGGFEEYHAFYLAEHITDNFIVKGIFSFYNKYKFKEYIYCKIDKNDSYNFTKSIAIVALPMLQLIRKEQRGFNFIDDEDVPDELATGNLNGAYDTGEILKWNFVLDEIILAFTRQLNEGWEKEFYANDKLSSYLSMIKSSMSPELVNEYKRNSKAFVLFGKYFEKMYL